MSFSVLAVLRQSLRRLATGPALLLLLALVVVQTTAALVPGRSFRTVPGLVQSGTGSPVLFTGNPLPALAGALGALLSGYLALVTIRVFAGQWGIVEREHLTHRVGWGLVNLYGVAVVLAVVFAVGLVVLGGLLGLVGLLLWTVFLLVVVAATFFTPAFVAVEDDNLLTALRKSAGVLTRNPLRVAALLVALLVVNAVLQAATRVMLNVLSGSPVVLGLLVSTVIGALGYVFLLIALARAYDHLGTASAG